MPRSSSWRDILASALRVLVSALLCNGNGSGSSKRACPTHAGSISSPAPHFFLKPSRLSTVGLFGPRPFSSPPSFAHPFSSSFFVLPRDSIIKHCVWLSLPTQHARPLASH